MHPAKHHLQNQNIFFTLLNVFFRVKTISKNNKSRKIHRWGYKDLFSGGVACSCGVPSCLNILLYIHLFSTMTLYMKNITEEKKVRNKK